jgi:hypothetical protein
MAIERNNSFHLMLSDDELALLKLLAEQKGLNASDYLRLQLREAAGPNPMMRALGVAGLLEHGGDLRGTFEAARTAAREAARAATRAGGKKR